MKIDLLDALRHVLAVFDIQLITVAPPFKELEHFDYGLRNALDANFDWPAMGKALLETTPERTLVRVEGTFGMEYFIFRLPDEPEDRAYIVGPWHRIHNAEETAEFRRWMVARTSEEVADLVEGYYNAVHGLKDEETFFNTICGLLATAFPHVDGREDFHIKLCKEYLPLNFRPDERSFLMPQFEQEVSMPLLEERYRNENEFMDAVTNGDAERAMLLVRQRKRFRYSGGRFYGELQERRNALIIFNVLMRKAIERAQVHPYYIDQISARYYERIRTITAEESPKMVNEMIVNYCRYVHEYSMQQYSPLIRSAINYINLNLASQLSLRVLAEQFFISPSYLSNLFRSETGVTLVDYIGTCRVKRAASLLTETNLSITNIAEQVGIVDVNYFAKIFKKAYHVTPTHYRRASREQNTRLPPQK